jgi:twitching motility two-component system response regulator PilG
MDYISATARTQGGSLNGESHPLEGMKVVLIDDSNTIRRSGEIFLAQAGCEVVLAEDGLDGLAKVAEANPDLILLDVMMPKLDGYQTCALIRNHPEFGKIPIVMLTSRDSLSDRAHGKLLGVEQYLIKPFDKKRLVDTVLAQTGRGAGSGG